MQESTKKSGTSRGDREKIMWNFHGSWFSTLEFPSDVTQFCRFSSGESIVFWNFQGYSDKSKNSSFFFNVYVQAPLLLRFFLEYPVKVSGSSLKAFLEQQYLKAFKLSHNDKIQGLIKKLNKQKKKFYTPSLFCPLCTESLIFSFLKSLQNAQQITNKEKYHAWRPITKWIFLNNIKSILRRYSTSLYL